MPAIHQGRAAPHAEVPTSPNNNSGGPSNVSHQPAPAVISSSSHVGLHVLSRRFIGTMPETVAHSDEAEEKRQRFKQLRKSAINKVLGDDDCDSDSLGHASRSHSRTPALGAVKHVIRRIRVTRRREDGEEVEEEFDLRDSDDEEEQGGFKRFKKKKEKRKNVWVGESFDIGREYRIIRGDIVDSGAAEGGHRPAASRHTTQDTFVTARTQLSATASRSSHIAPAESVVSSLISPARDQRDSEGSSMRPLIDTTSRRAHFDEEQDYTEDEEGQAFGQPKFRTRLKSAIRRPRPGSAVTSPPRRMANRDSSKKARDVQPKSVQFPVDPVTKPRPESLEPPRKGNKAPASPRDVLSRQGDAVAGTSAGAVEEALEDEDAEEDIAAGSVVLRDRMLVRVGHHEEEYTGPFDEATQRRSPCRRMEPMEEFIVVWRKQRVEFYQDWSAPLQERIKGCKRLCFIVPLQPNRTSLAIFNETDMSLSLSTSAGRLMDDVDRFMRSRTTKKQIAMAKDRVAQSRQTKWLRRGGRGSHVFIMKASERSRAFDWYWEIWRELGGELPSRIDVAIPALGTSVRLLVPEDPDQVGGPETMRIFAADTVVETCWEMLEGVLSKEALQRQRTLGRTAALAWKSNDGGLDWIIDSTTVQGRSRDWAVLAGATRQNAQQFHALQLRQAQHQATYIHLADGSHLEEPPAVEGFLVRHDASKAKEEVYIATHDGNIFMSRMKNANPPLPPAAEGSTPLDIFEDLHQAHVDLERKRMTSFIERSAGYVDLRDITSIDLAEQDLPVAVQNQQGQPESKVDIKYRSFVAKAESGQSFRFETQSRADAEEWVGRLKALVNFWRRKQRVDARLRMDAMALHSHNDPFAGTSLGQVSDEILADVWDWCTLKGCRSITYAGRVYIKTSRFAKYRLRYVVLAGGMLITFKIKKKEAFNLRRKRFSLFGSYVYSGMMAHDELHEQADRDALASIPRVYQDGMQSADGAEDTTFVIRLAVSSSWTAQGRNMWDQKYEIPLSKKAQSMLFVRARSSLERDRWVWAINAEMERMVRSHVEVEEVRRNYGVIPDA